MKTTTASLLLLLPAFVHAWPGEVVRVIDGDTLIVNRLEVAEPEPPVRIRLASINAPEKKDPGGAEATEALTALVEGGQVEVKPLKYGKYGRLIAEIKVPGEKCGEWQDVGATLLASGNAVAVDW